MFSKETYKERRAELTRKMSGKGLILLPGHTESPINYPNNAYRFRQESNFLYYFGLALPGLAGAIDTDTGETTLFGDDFTIDDIIWMGPQPRVSELGESVGITHTAPFNALEAAVNNAVVKGREVHFLPPYRGETKLLLERLFAGANGSGSSRHPAANPSEELIRAVV